MNGRVMTIVGLCVVLAGSTALAGDRIFRIEDARGDDYGDGSIVYPEIADWQPGDLDLVWFEAEAVPGGTEFSVRFARNVKEPDRRPLDGFVLLSDLARFGFYNLNVDVYIDMDREPGSGRVTTLPGRLAEVHPDYAWEKVVALTPRPYTASSVLQKIMVADAKREIKREQGTVRRSDVDVARDQVEVEVADDVHFPNRIRVAGPTITFTVPDTFLGQTASADWAYTVVVTGCDLMTSLQTADVGAGFVGLPYSGLMILPVKEGGSRYTFGSREPDVEMLPPIIDLIVPEGMKQEEVLRSFDVLAEQKAQLPGVVPSAD
jgi:hypothetical protein